MKAKAKIRKFVAMFLILVLSASSVVFAQSRSYEHLLDEYEALVEAWGVDFTYNYLNAIELIDRLYDSLPQNRLGATIYPDSFGGIYINDDGNLVILVVQSYALASPVAFTRNIDGNGAIIKEVEFAYNALRDAFAFLGDFIPNNPELLPASNVDGISLDVVNNEILVSLAVYTEEKIALFVDMILDAPFVSFHQSPGLPEFNFDFEPDYFSEILYSIDEQIIPTITHTVRPGDALRVRNASGILVNSGSVGYIARMDWQWQNRLGFVTAAHLSVQGRLIRAGDRFYNSSGTEIGIVREAQRHTADVAFVEITNALGSQSVFFGGLSRNEASNVRGNRVFLDARHGSARAGIIGDPWQGSTGTGWTGGYIVSITTQGGDSGGIVYTWRSAFDNGINGILAAGWDGGDSVFTSVRTHRNSLGGGLRFP